MCHFTYKMRLNSHLIDLNNMVSHCKNPLMSNIYGSNETQNEFLKKYGPKNAFEIQYSIKRKINTLYVMRHVLWSDNSGFKNSYRLVILDLNTW
jgi:hypothetical protein